MAGYKINLHLVSSRKAWPEFKGFGLLQAEQTLPTSNTQTSLVIERAIHSYCTTRLIDNIWLLNPLINHMTAWPMTDIPHIYALYICTFRYCPEVPPGSRTKLIKSHADGKHLSSIRDIYEFSIYIKHISLSNQMLAELFGQLLLLNCGILCRRKILFCLYPVNWNIEMLLFSNSSFLYLYIFYTT